MKNIGVLIVALCLIVACNQRSSVVGNGNVITENRVVDNFDEIAVYGSFVVDVVADQSKSVQVEADSNIVPYIRTEVDGNTLKIKIAKGTSVSNPKLMNVKVHVPVLKEIESMGASHITAQKIKADDFEVETAGASKIVLSGQVKDLTIKSNGASQIDAISLEASEVNVKANGAAKVKVNAKESLQVKIAGTAKIGYSGSPVQITQKIFGTGVIEKIN